MAKRANELIAFHLCCDIADVSEGRYQRYTAPCVYVVGSHYFCAPTANQRLPKGVAEGWEIVGTYYGRNVYRSTN